MPDATGTHNEYLIYQQLPGLTGKTLREGIDSVHASPHRYRLWLSAGILWMMLIALFPSLLTWIIVLPLIFSFAAFVIWLALQDRRRKKPLLEPIQNLGVPEILSRILLDFRCGGGKQAGAW